MTGRLLVLTGAPESERLDWSPSGLLSEFQPAVARFALLPRPHHQSKPQPTPHHRQDISVLDLAAWRSLPLHRPQIPTGFSQPAGAFPSSADFLTTASISSSSDASRGGDSGGDEDGKGGSRLLAEFYEHSLLVHHNLCSSQLIPGPQSQQHAAGFQPSVSDLASDNSRSYFDSDEEAEDTTTLADGTAVMKTPLLRRRGADHLSDLEDIPPASYLISIAPQTMTVTLIVGIISITPPRTVETRYGATRALIEVLVGDETKSGFAVTFWLSEADARAGTGGMLPCGLRTQDIVLVQNVALNVFRNKVYGGSLRRDMTSVHLLYRARTVDDEDGGGYYSKADLAKTGRSVKTQQDPQLEKTRRVRDWGLKFVGGGGGGDDGVGGEPKMARTTATAKGKKRATAPRNWNQPPPLDSQ